MAYFDFVTSGGSGTSDYGLINSNTGTVYYYSENVVVTTTLPAAATDMYVNIRYELPQNGNYINVEINDVQAFAWSYSDGSAVREVLFKLKQGEVLKITCKSLRTGGTMSYYTFSNN